MTKRSAPSPRIPLRRPSASITSSRSLYGHVVHELGRRIIEGGIKPGELLTRFNLDIEATTAVVVCATGFRERQVCRARNCWRKSCG